MTAPAWYVVQTEPCREPFVTERLHRDGFQPYLPRIRLPNSGRIASLFPGYVFCAAADRWYAIKGTIGVRQILMSGQTPAKLPPTVVNELHAREDRNGFVRLPPPPRYRRGQHVGIIRGSFKGFTGIYQGMGAKDRERVLINWLGGERIADLPASDLAPPQRAHI